MSKETARNLFIVSSMPGLYQQLFSGISNYEQLATRILGQIETAHAFRQTEKVRELSRILINIPIKEYQLIAQYYLVWCRCRELDFHDQLLERIAEQSYSYRTQALISRAAFDFYRGNFDDALRFYTESLRTRPTVSECLSAVKGIAVIKSLEGFGRSALNDLEKLTPLLRYANPIVYFDLLNSYAVELGEAGRDDEARGVSRFVLASPFIHAYPEWQQTAADLQAPSRSMVQVVGSRADSPSPDNVLSMTLAPERVVESPPLRPGKVLDYVRYKNKMAKKKAEVDENIDKMDRKDLVVKMLELISPEDVDEEKLRFLVKQAVEVMTSRK